MRTPAVLGVVLASAAIGAGGVVAVDAATTKPAKREALAKAVDPVGGSGDTLGLSRVTVPPGTALPKHHHPGTQTAYIDRGVLTYTVFSGHVDVMRGDADGTPVLVRRISAWQTRRITAGQWIVEQPDVHHKARNATGESVVIYLATLFPNGSPPSIVDPS